MPYGSDISRMADKHTLDTYLYDSLGALRANRKTMYVQVRAVETSTIERSIIYAVLFCVHYELVLGLSVMQAFLTIFYPTREAVVALREDLSVFAYGHSSNLRAWIFRPRRYMLS